MKSLMNMLYDFAIESNLTNSNISRMIHNISYKKYAVEHEKAPTEQVYVNDEEENIIKRALKQYEKTGNTAYLGICLNFTLALRVGEVVALKTRKSWRSNARRSTRSCVTTHFYIPGAPL